MGEGWSGTLRNQTSVTRITVFKRLDLPSSPPSLALPKLSSVVLMNLPMRMTHTVLPADLQTKPGRLSSADPPLYARGVLPNLPVLGLRE